MSLPTPDTPGYGSFRGRTACNCLIAWLPVFEAELQRRGYLAGDLPVYQLTGGAAASGGTHASGGAFDISDLVGEQDVWVARQMGAPATWARTRAQGFPPHLHGVLRGCPHNGPAAYQIEDVENGWNGLAGDGRARDDGPRPIPDRTWREGIAWAIEQEDDMKAEDWTRLQNMLDAQRKSIVADLLAAAVTKAGDSVKKALRLAAGLGRGADE